MTSPSILLFGSPGAGKSSLLGALAQASANQAPALKGQLIEESGHLTKLAKRAYDGKITPNEKLESYDIRLDGEPAADATLLDCSGKDALELLKAERPFEIDHPMHRPILDADAVLLLVDASMTGKQLGEEFQQFGKWLMQLHETRGARLDPGDLPVYLVLTKCDQLAKTGDTFKKWLDKVEEAKRRVHDKFDEYLKDQGDGFGSLDLKLWATAIKRPLLADKPARPTEPLGVAELFREGLHAAADFQERRRTAQHRLPNVLVGILALIAMLGLGIALTIEYQPDQNSVSLEERAHRALPKKDLPGPARLGGTFKKLEEKRQTLAAVESDPGFPQLAGALRETITRQRQEYEHYLALNEDLKTEAKLPFMAKTEEEFLAQEKAVRALVLPNEWEKTAVGARILQCRQEYEHVRAEIGKEQAWLQEELKACNALLDEGTELQLKLRKKQKLGPREVDLWENNYRVRMQPRSRALRTDNIPKVSSVTYEFLDKFQAVKDTRKKWLAVKVQLKRVAENIQDEWKAAP